jgi:hypothetical protein
LKNILLCLKNICFTNILNGNELHRRKMGLEWEKYAVFLLIMALSCEKGRIESGTLVGDVKETRKIRSVWLVICFVSWLKRGTLLRALRLVRKSIWPDHTSEIWITERYLFLHYIK